MIDIRVLLGGITIYKAKKGQSSYGEAIGILMLDAFTPFIPGDVANASSYNFPVRFQKVEGFTVKRALEKDPSIFENLLAASEDLVRNGVRAVTGDCGFMGIHQRSLARRLDVPVFLSSLLQIPFISRIVGDDKKVGIITADSRSLDAPLLAAMGIKRTDNLQIRGLEDKANFYKAVIEESGTLNPEGIEHEVTSLALQMVAEEPRLKAILLECSCLPPYGAAVQVAVNLPVFDYMTMINYVYLSLVKRRFEGFM